MAQSWFLVGGMRTKEQTLNRAKENKMLNGLIEKYGKRTVLIVGGLVVLVVLGLLIPIGVEQAIEATIND